MERGFVVLPEYSFPPCVRHSLTNAERPLLLEQKAKDWSGLEKICKREPVETPKVQAEKLLHGCGAIYAEDRLMLIVAVAAPIDGYEP